MNDTWLSVVFSDDDITGRNPLLVARSLARLADDNGTIVISVRSLGDAMLGERFDPQIGRPGDGGWNMAASRGLASLESRGYLFRMNPGAPRNRPGRYMLTIPARRLLAAC